MNGGGNQNDQHLNQQINEMSNCLRIIQNFYILVEKQHKIGFLKDKLAKPIKLTKKQEQTTSSRDVC